MPVNRKMMKSMKEQYGPEKGERVYYAKESQGFNKEQKMKKKSGYSEGGQVDKPGKPKRLREVPETNTGLKQLPEKVRNSMGYMSKGGMASKAKGYNKGGYANCGASMKPNRMAKK
jgi:hypothetical protein